MSLPQLSLDAFPAWALLNDQVFHNVKLQDTKDKGFGLLAETRLSTVDGTSRPLITVPRDLVLSRETVEDYAKVDSNFRQLLDAMGRQRPVRDIVVLYLAVHMVLLSRASPRGPASSPWTEYIKFLPRPIPVPTMWNETERELLSGTSLEYALAAKMNALAGEVEQLREASSGLPFWDSLLWNSGVPVAEYWVLADAWFRSRSLELPGMGEAMVPGLDMVNHSAAPNAYYDVDRSGGVALLLRPEVDVAAEQEVTISYGEGKSPAEMLFSYGFIDGESSARELTLPLNPLPDDPLAKAKLHIFGGAPTIKLAENGGVFSWESPFAYLMCLNEEDGLEFRVLQDMEGERHLKLFWQDEDVTERPDDFKNMTRCHVIGPLIELRVVMTMTDLVSLQAEAIASTSSEQLARGEEPEAMRRQCIEAAETLQGTERAILEGSALVLQERASTLLQDEAVQSYLGSTAETPMEREPASPPGDADEFS